MGKDLYDSFDTESVLSKDCITKLDELLRREVAQGSSPQESSVKYKLLLDQLLAAQGTDLEAARRVNPGFIYIEAAVDVQQFQELLGETAAAKAQGKKIIAAWEPPPDDDEPETAHDYA